MNTEEIKDRLIRLDEDAELTFGEEINFKCYIVGGGALILMGYIIRATHDLDVLEIVPKQLKPLFEKYDMNTDVMSYYDCFPQNFEKRANYIDLPTNKIQFYTLSLEDLVISKLCTTRGGQDITDINSQKIISSIDWEVLARLAESMKYSMLSSVGYDNFIFNYNEYVRRNKVWGN